MTHRSHNNHDLRHIPWCKFTDPTQRVRLNRRANAMPRWLSEACLYSFPRSYPYNINVAYYSRRIASPYFHNPHQHVVL